MTALVDPAELIGPSEIAVLAGVTRGCVSNWQARGRFVEPVARIGNSNIFLRSAVVEWLAREAPRRPDPMLAAVRRAARAGDMDALRDILGKDEGNANSNV